MDVTFRPPSMGSTVVPIPLTGDGTFEIVGSEIVASGFTVASKARGLILVLGVVGFALVAGLAKVVFGLPDSISMGVGAAIGAAFVTPMLKKPAKEGEPLELRFSQTNIKKVIYDASAECLVVVLKGMKPKGGIFIVQEKNSALEAQVKKLIGKKA